MAIINYLGLTGTLRAVDADPASATLNSLIPALAADETLNSSYYIVSLLRDPSKNSISAGAQTLNQLGWLPSDVILCTPNQVGTKEYRQIQKLEIAQYKRRAWGNTSAGFYRTLNTYDRDILPAKYVVDTSVPNSHPTGLIQGRPWIGGGGTPGYIIQEDEFYILLEDGSYMLNEDNTRMFTEEYGVSAYVLQEDDVAKIFTET